MPSAERFLFNRLVDCVLPGAGMMMDMLEVAELASELAEAGEVMESFQDVNEARKSAEKTLRNMVEKKGIVKRCRGRYACGEKLSVMTRGGRACDACWKDIKETTPHLACSSCGYDLCAVCSLEDDDSDDDSDDGSDDDSYYSDSDDSDSDGSYW